MRDIRGGNKYFNILVNDLKLVPDVITMNSIINIHAQVGNVEGAVYYYNQFHKYKLQPDLVTMNAMINTYAQAGDLAGAIEQYNQIQTGNHISSIISILILILYSI